MRYTNFETEYTEIDKCRKELNFRLLSKIKCIYRKVSIFQLFLWFVFLFLFYNSIVNRGKLIHSAMNSLHNFDRSLDKFLAWLSEIESSVESIDAEPDVVQTRKDNHSNKPTTSQLKVSKNNINLFYSSMGVG